MSLFCIAALSLISGGCADPVVFSEVFQLEKGQEICTKYNIWYDDPQEISCLNIQHGGFIPIGTVIEPLGTDNYPERIRFKVKSTGKEYAILTDDITKGWSGLSTREYKDLKGLKKENDSVLL